MYDTGENPSFQTFYVRPLDLHGEELPRVREEEESAEYEAKKEERDATRAQRREAEKDHTIHYFADAPKTSMAYPDSDMIDPIKEVPSPRYPTGLWDLVVFCLVRDPD